MNNNIITAPVLLELDPWLIFFKNWLRKWEGFRPNVYLDSGDLPTIGTGITIYPNGTRVSLLDKSLTSEEDWAMLDEILKPRIEVVNTIVVTPILPQQRIALIDFVYNLGNTAFAKSTLLKRINDTPNDPKIAEEIMKWVFCDGKKLNGLIRRRKAEVDLYFS